MKYLKYAIIVLFLGAMVYGAVNVYQRYAISTMAHNRPAPAAIAPAGEPTGGSATQRIAPPPPPMNKVKVLGLIELELSQANTWSTVLQLLALILGSAIGVKIINTTFKKFE